MVRRPALILGLALVLALPAMDADAQSRRRRNAKPPPAPTAAAPRPAPAQPVGLAALLAADETRVKAELGVPDIARDEGAAALWTYRWNDCALLVFFRRADGRTLRVSGAEANPRRRGQPRLTVDACLAHAKATGHAAPDSRAIDALLDAPG